jgi:ATP-dependent Lon protease
MDNDDQVGSATGLVVTPVGGDVVTVEVGVMEGREELILTGQLGDVMKESARAALTWIKAHGAELGIAPERFEKSGLHIHVPAGAIPKDGPSAGVTMATAIVSALTGIPVRKEVAMTGEITLRGRVLPIGGLKEKLLAALRSGITTVFIPKDNEKDLAEVPDNVRKHLKIIPVAHVDEVIGQALVRKPEPIEWVEPADPVAAAVVDVPAASLPH